MGENSNNITEFMRPYSGKNILLIAVRAEENYRYYNHSEDIGRCVQEMLNQMQTGMGHGSYYRVTWNSFMGIVTDGDMLELATHVATILRQNREMALINRCAIVQTQGSAEELFTRWEDMLCEKLSDFIKRDVSGEIQIIDGKILGK